VPVTAAWARPAVAAVAAAAAKECSDGLASLHLIMLFHSRCFPEIVDSIGKQVQ